MSLYVHNINRDRRFAVGQEVELVDHAYNSSHVTRRVVKVEKVTPTGFVVVEGLPKIKFLQNGRAHGYHKWRIEPRSGRSAEEIEAESRALQESLEREATKAAEAATRRKVRALEVNRLSLTPVADGGQLRIVDTPVGLLHVFPVVGKDGMTTTTVHCYLHEWLPDSTPGARSTVRGNATSWRSAPHGFRHIPPFIGSSQQDVLEQIVVQVGGWS